VGWIVDLNFMHVDRRLNYTRRFLLQCFANGLLFANIVLYFSPLTWNKHRALPGVFFFSFLPPSPLPHSPLSLSPLALSLPTLHESQKVRTPVTYNPFPANLLCQVTECLLPLDDSNNANYDEDDNIHKDKNEEVEGDGMGEK
jgi:hypothetical protein